MLRRLSALVCFVLIVAPAMAQNAAEKAQADGKAAVDKAIAWMISIQQPDGSFQRSDREPPAITALVLKTIAQDPKLGPKSEPAKKAIAYLLATQKDDGGFYKDMLANYNTAITVSALVACNDPSLKPAIDKGVAYLKMSQSTDPATVGGWNYGGQRGGAPDVSNSAIVLDALKDSGLPSDDPAYQNAVKFLAKLQNHSETNPSAWAGNDGGFIYNLGKDGAGESSAGEYTGEGGKRMLRSYGSMTYAGLKSMIYAGLKKDDPRVKAAWNWIRSNWTVDEHPGLSPLGADRAKDGIFYFYHTMSRSLAAYGEPNIVDSQNKSHDWRAELIAKLSSIQRPDGSFSGTQRWMENNPIIATSLATLALQDAVRDLGEKK